MGEGGGGGGWAEWQQAEEVIGRRRLVMVGFAVVRMPLFHTTRVTFVPPGGPRREPVIDSTPPDVGSWFGTRATAGDVVVSVTVVYVGVTYLNEF